MDSVYKQATVTISAANSRSVNDGFLTPRAPSESIDSPFVLPNGEVSTVSISEFDGYVESDEPLNRRAWTFQESILSPRRLIFGQKELLWNCQTLPLHPVVPSNTVYFPKYHSLSEDIFNPSVMSIELG